MEIRKVTADSAEEAELVISLRRLLQETEATQVYKEIRTDEGFLLKFSRAKKYNLENAYDSVFRYYRCMHRNKDIVETAVSTNTIYALNVGFFKALNPGTCKKNSTSVYFEPGLWKPKEIPLLDHHRAVMFFVEEMLSQKDVQLNGASMLINLAGFSYRQAFQFTPKECKRLIFGIQDGYPVRIVGIHFINYPALFWGFYTLIKQFMKEKLKKRIYLHPNLESLDSHFCKEKLPAAIGGPLEDLSEFQEHQAVLKRLEEREFEFKEYFTPTVTNVNLT